MGRRQAGKLLFWGYGALLIGFVTFNLFNSQDVFAWRRLLAFGARYLVLVLIWLGIRAGSLWTRRIVGYGSGLYGCIMVLIMLFAEVDVRWQHIVAAPLALACSYVLIGSGRVDEYLGRSRETVGESDAAPSGSEGAKEADRL